MAHGEAEHGCAQGEPCRLGNHEQQGPLRPHRRLAAVPCPTEQAGRAPERADDEVTVPRQRPAEPAPAEAATSRPRGVEPGPRPPAGEPATSGEPDPTTPRACRSDLAGWAGAHRHGPVRPTRRPDRRQRPPHRWC
ncbi:hypothetical protein ACFT9M_26505 [Micromonospora purpureochromogenes]|uniref:hypothetical protein n=1 Tax=Micromonospora purpureochromogenes TaxID=47872 RepID=UPI00363D689F